MLYNTLTGEQLVYRNRKDIAKLLERMTCKKNLNAIIENKAILEKEGMAAFLKKAGRMRLIDWYDFIKENKSHKKPVSIPAILNIHRERRKMMLDPERNLGEDIKKYLHKVNIYINSYKRSDHNNLLFTRGYKQFLYPYSLGKYTELKINWLQTLLDQIKEVAAFNLTILGGNIFQYNQIEALTGYLETLPMKKEFAVFYRDVNRDRLSSIDWKKLDKTSLRVFVEPQFQQDEMERCFELIQRFNISATFQFPVETERDLDRLDEMTGLPEGSKFLVKPFYNGNNYRFFRKNVFIKTADLSDPPITKRDIYARSIMNSNMFGEITILSSGDIYSNVNENRIGTIDREIREVLVKEVHDGKGWFRIRKHLTPCKGCIYNQICPPISNYEYALSRNNLCTISERPHPGV